VQRDEQAWLEFTREQHVFHRDRTPVLGHVAIGEEEALANEASHHAGEPWVAPASLENRQPALGTSLKPRSRHHGRTTLMYITTASTQTTCD
jgi:hypothetical protein